MDNIQGIFDVHRNTSDQPNEHGNIPQERVYSGSLSECQSYVAASEIASSLRIISRETTEEYSG